MFFINPFIYGGAGGDFESIATVTVGSGGAADIQFTSIPATYQHLQIRGVFRATGSVLASELYLRINGASSDYARHWLTGNGSAASASGGGGQAVITHIYIPGSTATASVFGASVIDILDYASASKATTTRGFTGFDRNGGGQVTLTSGLYTPTDAVTSIRLWTAEGDWAQHTTAALYGIKAP